MSHDEGAVQVPVPAKNAGTALAEERSLDFRPLYKSNVA